MRKKELKSGSINSKICDDNKVNITRYQGLVGVQYTATVTHHNHKYQILI